MYIPIECPGHRARPLMKSGILPNNDLNLTRRSASNVSGAGWELRRDQRRALAGRAG